MLVYDRLEEVGDDDEAEDDDRDPNVSDTEEWDAGDSDAAEDVADDTEDMTDAT